MGGYAGWSVLRRLRQAAKNSYQETTSGCSLSNARRWRSVMPHCPVVAECLADALDNRVEFGVSGEAHLDDRRRHAGIGDHPRRRRLNTLARYALTPPQNDHVVSEYRLLPRRSERVPLDRCGPDPFPLRLIEIQR